MDVLIAFLAQYFYLVVALLGVAFLVWEYRTHLMELVVETISIGLIAYLLSKVGTLLVNSPRPFVESGHAALIASATDNGFPSDHTLLLAVIAVLVSIPNSPGNRRANRRVGLSFWAPALFWALALVVGLARVYAGVHHLIDIAGSFVIAALAGCLYVLARQRWRSIRKRSDRDPLPY